MQPAHAPPVHASPSPSTILPPLAPRVGALIATALEKPKWAIPYALGRELEAIARAGGGREILATEDWRFDLRGFAAVGKCEARPRPDVHALVNAVWDSESAPVTYRPLMGLFEVVWNGRGLEVLEVRYDCEHASWIVAETRELAEAFFAAVCEWSRSIQPRDELLVFEGGRFRKSNELRASIQRTTFESLSLAADFIRPLREDCAGFFAAEADYDRVGVAWRRGVLLTGPPGNGKTHTIKALTNELGKPCLYIRSFESFGDERQAVREVFRRARDSAPCLVVMEDLETLVTPRCRSFFLNELDGFAENRGILLIATTNHPSELDPAIVERPSRFDRRYDFALPGESERLAFLRRWSAALEPGARANDTTLRQLAAATVGFSYAYLKELTHAALLAWIRTNGSRDALDAHLHHERAALSVYVAGARSA